MTELPTLYSGAAAGADSAFMKYAEEFNFPQTHFVIDSKERKHCRYMSYPELQEATPSVELAAKRLGKNPPRKIFVWKLIHRNWFQIKDSEAVFAIGTLSSSLKNVNGGTGWAVAMAIECTDIKDIYMFDQERSSWFEFNREKDIFQEVEELPSVPSTYKGFAGIGTRDLSPIGEEEIRNLFVRGQL